MPFMHMPPSQEFPQPPQLFLSLLGLMQARAPASVVPASPAQSRNIPAHSHIDAEQIMPWPHLAPHAPQLAGLLVVLVHTGGMPHSMVVGGQTQAPAVHTAPPVQASPHPPQLAASVCVSTHAPVQLVVLTGQVTTQLPAHTCVAAQGMAQPPQFCGSVAVLVQTPLQRVPPLGHSQVLLLQTWPPTHLMPHPPQLLTSPFVFTQEPPHMIC
jgi:hypothetical protein